MNIIFRMGMIVLLASACTPNQETKPQSKHNKNDLQDQFEYWKAKQNPQLLLEYQTYLAKHLEFPPTLFELSYNQHIEQSECMQYQFAIAPESEWKNLIQPLQLLEQLKQQQVINQYKIVSIYRGHDANQCSRGAKHSKHLSNHAVDFQIIDNTGQILTGIDQATLSRICQFWKQNGRKINMGLGTYANNKFHIDVQGYRSWGSNYKRDSSLCLSELND